MTVIRLAKSDADKAPKAHRSAQLYIDNLVKGGGDIDRVSAQYQQGRLVVSYNGQLMKQFELNA